MDPDSLEDLTLDLCHTIPDPSMQEERTKKKKREEEEEEEEEKDKEEEEEKEEEKRIEREDIKYFHLPKDQGRDLVSIFLNTSMAKPLCSGHHCIGVITFWSKVVYY